VFILSVSSTIKYYLTKKIIIEFSEINAGKIHIDLNYYMMLIFFAVAMFFSVPVQDPAGLFLFERYYIGKISPNVWHNSTVIFLFPFALLLFYKQSKMLVEENATARELIEIFVLIIINILIKPSFFFVYAPVTFFFLVIRFKNRKKELSVRLIPIIAGLLILYLMFKILFLDNVGGYGGNEGSIALSEPFEAWLHFSPAWYLPVAMIFSLLFPLVYFLLYPRYFLKDQVLKYSFSLFFVGILISSFLIEEGPRKYHGNLMWQNVICMYILMLSSISGLLKVIKEKGSNSAKVKILILVLTLHLLSGLAYIFQLVTKHRIS
jgi:hypothetical protein